MKLPRNVSGRELCRALERAFGYRPIHQVGSHVILQVESPRPHRIAVPDHKSVRPGTLNAVVRAVAVAQDIAKAEVLRRLFG